MSAAAAQVEGLGAQPLGRTGGIYIPPFKLAMMRKEQSEQDNSSKEHQKQTWEALRKSLNGLINKVNVANIKNIVGELFQENLIRGRGLFSRAIMKAQQASPGFTHIYTALIAVINTKLPENGELLLKRVVYSFNRSYKRRDKLVATASAKFIAHLVNFQIAHELIALQLLTVLLEQPTDDSVEIAVNFIKEVGQTLEELSPQGMHAIFERFRAILQEGDIDKRVQYTIEDLFAVRKSGFKDYPAVPSELDLVEKSDQITFEISLDDEIDREEMLDVFREDPEYVANEEMWAQIRSEILGDEEEEEEGEAGAEGGAGEGGVGDGEFHGGEEEEEGEGAAPYVPPVGTEGASGGQTIDMTEQDLINLRRTLYLTIMSSVSFEECSHKIAKLKIPDGYESELCNMLVECCANEKSYLRYYGLMGQRFCMMRRKYQDAFDVVFMNQYNTIHRLETNKLRNVAKFFAHLLSTDALPWTCFEYIKLNEEDTTSSSRIFIKVVIQELAEMSGLPKVKERFMDPRMGDIFAGLFPKDSARNTRFAINFFTSIGLGILTDDMREHLKNAPKLLALQLQQQALQLQQQQAAEEEERKKRKLLKKQEKEAKKAASKSKSRGSRRRSRSYSSSSGSSSGSYSSSDTGSYSSSSSSSRSSYSSSGTGSSYTSYTGSSRSYSSGSYSSSGSGSCTDSGSYSGSSRSRSRSGSYSSYSSRSGSGSYSDSGSGSESEEGSRRGAAKRRSHSHSPSRSPSRSRSPSPSPKVAIEAGRKSAKHVPPHRRRAAASKSRSRSRSASPVAAAAPAPAPAPSAAEVDTTKQAEEPAKVPDAASAEEPVSARDKEQEVDARGNDRRRAGSRDRRQDARRSGSGRRSPSADRIPIARKRERSSSNERRRDSDDRDSRRITDRYRSGDRGDGIRDWDRGRFNDDRRDDRDRGRFGDRDRDRNREGDRDWDRDRRRDASPPRRGDRWSGGDDRRDGGRDGRDRRDFGRDREPDADRNRERERERERERGRESDGGRDRDAERPLRGSYYSEQGRNEGGRNYSSRSDADSKRTRID